MNFKIGPLAIVVVGVLLFFLTLQSSILGLVAVIAIMLGYTYWKWNNKEKAKPEIIALVTSCIKPNMVWPTKIVISKERISALHEKLLEKKINLPEATVSNMVETELIKQIEARFETSFYEHNKELPQYPTERQWVQAYAKTFNNNMNYVPLLKRLAKKRGSRMSLKLLNEKIHEEVKKQVKK